MLSLQECIGSGVVATAFAIESTFALSLARGFYRLARICVEGLVDSSLV
ncbi:hypothetical protein [Helicobacter canis]|nr:hypothetical protein [Helicobacter canis]